MSGLPEADAARLKEIVRATRRARRHRRPSDHASPLDATAGLAHVWALVRDLEDGRGWTTSPTLKDRWTELVMDGLLLGHPSSHRHVLRRDNEPAAGPRALRELLEQLHAHPERPWTTAAMARAVGVGVRSRRCSPAISDNTRAAPLQGLGDPRATESPTRCGLEGARVGLHRRCGLRHLVKLHFLAGLRLVGGTSWETRPGETSRMTAVSRTEIPSARSSWATLRMSAAASSTAR